jgi:hypothetical protein
VCSFWFFALIVSHALCQRDAVITCALGSGRCDVCFGVRGSRWYASSLGEKRRGEECADHRAAAPSNQTTPAAPATPTSTGAPDVATTSQSRFFKPHFESHVTGFETPTSLGRDVGTTSLPQPDVVSIIQSFLTTAMPMMPVPSIHLEKSEDGWQEASQSLVIQTGDQHAPMIEVTADGWATTAVVPPSYTPQITNTIGRATPQVSGPQVVFLPQVTPPPAITQGGITLRPVPVTSVRVTTVDGKPTTVEALINYRYVAGSVTLQVGKTTTINDVVVALSVDSAGSTVLVAGDQTTTLPPPARGNQAPQTTGSSSAVTISTTVIEGTTKYILAGQTLAPGQAITVGDIPISIGTRDGSTVLVLGGSTTTFAGGPTTMSDSRASVAATSSGIHAATTSAKAGSAPNLRTTNPLLTKLIGLAALAQPFL